MGLPNLVRAMLAACAFRFRTHRVSPTAGSDQGGKDGSVRPQHVHDVRFLRLAERAIVYVSDGGNVVRTLFTDVEHTDLAKRFYLARTA